MANLLIQIRAADRATFWAAAVAIGLGEVEPDYEGNDQLVTSPNIDIHDGEGDGLQIVTVPAVYDAAGNETIPATIAAEYHANIVINGTNNTRIIRWLDRWQKYGAPATERGMASGHVAMGVSMISGMRTPQHAVAI